MAKWRPGYGIPNFESQAYEEGADALLKALRNSNEAYRPNSVGLSQKELQKLQVKINNHEHPDGRFVFIPDKPLMVK